MLAQTLAQSAPSVRPWAFQWHPEVWLLVAFLTGAYIYMVRVIGPKAVGPGNPAVTRGNVYSFVGAMAMLWIASDWPLHDISEDYLYSAHMLQHMMLSYFLPPLALMATPTWLMRVLVGDGRAYRALTFLAKPIVAGVLFNVVIIVTHVPLMVNASVENGPLHYSLHFVVVMSSLLMWMPVVGPFPELHMTPLGKCIYLFLQSVVPTIPAAWLTFASGAVYSSYDQPVRVWGITVTDDQQIAGAIMKVGGSVFLWSIVIYLFFRRFAANYAEEHNYRRAAHMPTAEITGHDEHPLTTEDVEREFARTPVGPVETD
jgi:putative membrane protein